MIMTKKLLAVLGLVSILAPLNANAITYTIRPGDTLSKIASAYGTTVGELAAANGIADPDLIYSGDVLTVGEEQFMGAGYNPVTGYQSRTTQYISTSASTIPVASTADKAGNQIVLSEISPTSTVKVYMNLEAGTTREEAIYCTGVTVSSWTGCVRGLSFQGGSETASTTLAKAHNAGSSIIITNIGQFYNQYVAVDGAQDVWGVKTFQSLPKGATVTTVPTTADQLATKYYVDSVGAGGFTASNVSTTRGLSVDGSIPERVGINASSTGNLAFDSTGKLYVTPTFNVPVTFNGRASSTAVATSSTDIIRWIEMEKNMATGTAGGTLTAGLIVRMGGDGKLYAAGATASTTIKEIVGVLEDGGALDGVVRYVKPGGIATISGVTAGSVYWLGGGGGVGTVPSTFAIKVGVGVGTNKLMFQPQPAKSIYSSYNASANLAGTTNVSLPFIPTRVDLICVRDGAFADSTKHKGMGWWVRNYDGSSNQFSVGSNSAGAPYFLASSTAACANGGMEVRVATTTNGINLIGTGGTGSDSYAFTAYYDEMQ